MSLLGGIGAGGEPLVGSSSQLSLGGGEGSELSLRLLEELSEGKLPLGKSPLLSRTRSMAALASVTTKDLPKGINPMLVALPGPRGTMGPRKPAPPPPPPPRPLALGGGGAGGPDGAGSGAAPGSSGGGSGSGSGSGSGTGMGTAGGAGSRRGSGALAGASGAPPGGGGPGGSSSGAGAGGRLGLGGGAILEEGEDGEAVGGEGTSGSHGEGGDGGGGDGGLAGPERVLLPGMLPGETEEEMLVRMAEIRAERTRLLLEKRAKDEARVSAILDDPDLLEVRHWRRGLVLAAVLCGGGSRALGRGCVRMGDMRVPSALVPLLRTPCLCFLSLVSPPFPAVRSSSCPGRLSAWPRGSSAAFSRPRPRGRGRSWRRRSCF